MEYFAESARTLIAEALELAGRRGDRFVWPVHVFVAARRRGLVDWATEEEQAAEERFVSSVSSGPRGSGDLSALHDLFQRAFKLATPGLVEADHLLSALEQGRLDNQINWLLNGPIFSWDLYLTPEVEQKLRDAGVDHQRVRKALPDVAVQELSSLLEAKMMSSRRRMGPMFFALVAGLKQGSELSRLLAGAGLSRQIAMNLLASYPPDSEERRGSSQG